MPRSMSSVGDKPLADLAEGDGHDDLRRKNLLPRVAPILAVTILTGVWAGTPHIVSKVEGSAVLLPPDSRIGFYSRSAGQVQHIYKQIGTYVTAGTLILSINRIDQDAQGSGSVGSNPNALLYEFKAIDIQQNAIKSRIQTLGKANKPVGQQLEALNQLRREEVIPKYSPLWIGAQDLYLRNEAIIKELESQLAQLDAKRAELRGQRLSQSVLSPRDGMILSLSVSPGQAVLPGQRLGNIGLGPAAGRSNRQAVALFSDADATRLRVGMPIQLDLQLQTRNEYGGTSHRYGVVEGKILSISPASADLAEVSRAVGDNDIAASLISRSRQAAFGEGGDPLAVVADKNTSPVRLVTLDLEHADTPSGLHWSVGKGPNLNLENGTPAKAEVEFEHRSALSYLLPFLRWLGGTAR